MTNFSTGDKVIIVNSAEETICKNMIFTVLSDTWNVCGTDVVKIKCEKTGKYYSSYACNFLRKIPS